MAKVQTVLPTPAELAILNVLWALGEATVDDVVKNQRSRPNYKTVQTVLRIMEEKGFVRHSTRGRVFVFEPCVSRKQVGKRSVRKLLAQTFGGSPIEMMINFLEAAPLSEDEVSQLESLIQDYKRGRKKHA